MIDTEIWEPNPAKPGYVHKTAQVNLKVIKQGIKDALKEIPYPDDPECSAYDVLEWINGPHTGWCLETPEDELWPERTTPVVTVKHGGSEGWHILILALDWKGEHSKQMFTIKYLIGREDTWTIAAALDKHFEAH